MTIEELKNIENLGTRTFNVCNYNDLETLDKIIRYFRKHNSFLRLRNCGRKSNQELIKICEKYNHTIEDVSKNTSQEILQKPLEEILQNLTRTQRGVINSFIKVSTNKLSVRSKNAISRYLKYNFSVVSFLEKILLNRSFNLMNIKNIGAKSIKELKSYISNVDQFIKKVSDLDDKKTQIELKNKFLIQETFKIEQIPAEIRKSEYIFQLTDFLLNEKLLFNKSYTYIVRHSLKLYCNQKELTLEKIADEVDITRERVRQVRKKCIKELKEKLSFIKNFNDELFQNYGIDKESHYIEIDSAIADKINELNSTNFSKEFITYVLFIYLSDDFYLVGDIEDVLPTNRMNKRTRHNWDNFYIVHNDLSKFDFVALANDIDKRINKRIQESYSLNFKGYLSNFIDAIDIELISLVFPVAEKIIGEEFGLYLDIDDNLVFKRNTIKVAFEYAYEALEKLDRQSSVQEITQKIRELYPNYKTKEDSIRASMTRENGFVPIGRKSEYGLKIWEERANFMGGTIRNIVRKYLIQFTSPKHIYEITQYVLKYRKNTYQRSILDNLKADTSETFIFFKQGFIGLNSKIHNYNVEKYKNLPTQLGKTLIKKYEKGLSKENLLEYLQKEYNLNNEESLAIINNLEIF